MSNPIGFSSVTGELMWDDDGNEMMTSGVLSGNFDVTSPYHSIDSEIQERWSQYLNRMLNGKRLTRAGKEIDA